MVGLQLAIRIDRLSALAMGGFPALNGPYHGMLLVTTAANDMAGGDPTSPEDEWSTGGMSKGQTQQFVTLYQALQEFDDETAQAQITCPRLCFVGSVDEIQYGRNWGEVFVSPAGPVIQERARLEALGWEVHVLDGLDHMQAMPILRAWWTSKAMPPTSM